MNHLLEPELDQETAGYSNDREISLGPGTILGIFFVLALICACFFGFGYSVGHRTAQAAVIQPVAPQPASLTPVANKPAAGSAAPPAPVDTPAETQSPAVPTDAAVATTAPAARPSPAITPSPALPAPATTAGAGSYMVQVAAVSTQDIADIEVSALKKDGYAVVVRREPQDKLFHVQIGPFADKNAAEDMRKRVQGDGFNAIVK